MRRRLSLSAGKQAAPLVLALLPAFWLSWPLLRKTPLSRDLAGHYDPQVEEPGRIRVRVNGEEVGDVPTRPAFLRHQRIQFDTRDHRDERATVEVSLTGSALRCFDLRTIK